MAMKAATVFAVLAAAGMCVGASLAQVSGGQPAKPATPEATPAPASAPESARPQIAAPDVKREPPPIQAEPSTVEMGYIRPGETKHGKTKLTNTGSEPITILRTHASCSCTVASKLDGVVVQPGESVEMEVSVKAKKFPGPTQNQVSIFVDGYAVPAKLFALGEIAYGVKSTPIYVDMMTKTAGSILFESTDGRKFTILAINGEAPVFDGFDPSKDEIGTQYTVKYDFTGVDPTTLPKWWVAETDHPEAPVVDLRVLHPAIWDQAAKQMQNATWQLGEDRVLAGTMRVGETKEITMHLQARPVDPAQKPALSTDSPLIDVEFVSGEMDSEGYGVTFKVTLKQAPEGGKTLLNAPVKIEFMGFDNTFTLLGRALPAS